MKRERADKSDKLDVRLIGLSSRSWWSRRKGSSRGLKTRLIPSFQSPRSPTIRSITNSTSSMSSRNCRTITSLSPTLRICPLPSPKNHSLPPKSQACSSPATFIAKNKTISKSPLLTNPTTPKSSRGFTAKVLKSLKTKFKMHSLWINQWTIC